MSCRSAVLIDNFLEQSKFDALSSKVASSSFYNTTSVFDTKDALWEEAYTAVFDRLKEINMYQFHYAESVKLFGYNQFRPANEGYGNFNGPHFDQGGYVLTVEIMMENHKHHNFSASDIITQSPQDVFDQFYREKHSVQATDLFNEVDDFKRMLSQLLEQIENDKTELD